MKPFAREILLILPGLMFPWAAHGLGEPLLQNGDFEAITTVNVGPDGRSSGWKLDEPALVPTRWNLNSAYPGQLSIQTAGAHGGKRFVRLAANAGGPAHLYQMCKGLERGKWYRVSAWVRGGPLVVHFYEYYEDKHIGGQKVVQFTSKPGQWRFCSRYYQPGGKGYLRSALAIYTSPGCFAEVDDVSIEPADLKNSPGPGPDLSFENPLARWTVSAGGKLTEVRLRATGKDYRVESLQPPMLTAIRNGMEVAAISVVKDGALLNVRFLDPDIKATLRVVARSQHFLIEVVDTQPQDIEQLTIEFPVQRAASFASAFNGTYDDKVGICLFGTTANARNLRTFRGKGNLGLRGACYRTSGIAGAKFALIVAPRSQFKSAIREAEKANGLPCPILEGEWARDSEAVRRSYLFATDVNDGDIDTLINYAKLGGFRTILILKNSWLANHGHYDVNRKNFPGGRESLKRAVQKIHEAGLHAGVHVFGPSISPNDPYITPKPDDRLASVPCPSLAKGVSVNAETLILSGPAELPPGATRTKAYYIRVGDEIIRYGKVEVGPPFRFLHCQRGALGTEAAPHNEGAEVKGLLTVWGFFLVDPDSTLADEITTNFASVVNECDFDMVYFDASDGIQGSALQGWYYLNKMHLGFYSKLKKDVLYQTSTGTGANILWHIVPRSASADGHGDIKGYLDQRWPGILRQSVNFTRSDIGWYYWFKAVRPDQIEYVCAKALGLDASISLETSVAACQHLSQSRQMFEMIGRYERCRRGRYFPEPVRKKLLELKKDFKLFEIESGKWKLYRAAYEPPRTVDVLDGRQNVWNIHHPFPQSCLLGIELLRGHLDVAAADYSAAEATVIENFSNPVLYRQDNWNQFGQFVIGKGKKNTPQGPVSPNVIQSFALSTQNPRAGQQSLVYSARNAGPAGGWGGIGRRFEQPLDLSAGAGIGLWIHGDGKHETIRIQFRDTSGRDVNFLPRIDFQGWRLFTFPYRKEKAFDWSKTAYLLFYFNGIPEKDTVQVMFGGVKMLRQRRKPAPGEPALIINGRRLEFPTFVKQGQTMTCEGPEGVTLWPGGMKPGRKLSPRIPPLELKPGLNRIELTWNRAQDFPGNLTVLLYRLWPLEKTGAPEQ